MKWLQRLEINIGANNINKLKKSTVVIIGLGGVGGHALESIVRSGIGNVVIIDKDVVDITNLNRQLISMHSNIGEYKTDVAKKRILDINPDCNVKCFNIFLDKSNIDLLFNEKADFIIDACDKVTTKIEIMKECIKNNIPLISSMGMGNRLDPTMIEIIDIKKTSYDPIAKVIRKKIKDYNIKQKITVVCSREKPFKTIDKIPGSNSLVPSTAGILCASLVINSILKKH